MNKLSNTVQTASTFLWYSCNVKDINEDKRQIIKDTKDVTVAYLYDHYYWLQHNDEETVCLDQNTAEALELPVAVISKCRRKLMKLGWIRYDAHRYKGDLCVILKVGKQQ